MGEKQEDVMHVALQLIPMRSAIVKVPDGWTLHSHSIVRDPDGDVSWLGVLTTMLEDADGNPPPLDLNRASIRDYSAADYVTEIC